MDSEGWQVNILVFYLKNVLDKKIIFVNFYKINKVYEFEVLGRVYIN